MVSPPTRPAAGALVLLLLTAGCLSGAPGGTPTPTPTPAATSTPGGTATATDGPTDWHSPAARSPDPDHAVTVDNRWSRSVDVHLRVVRSATNETVHEATHAVPAGTERSVYDTAQADPDGVEEFVVVATARNATESVTVETSACYGDVHATVDEEGDLRLVYAVC